MTLGEGPRTPPPTAWSPYAPGRVNSPRRSRRGLEAKANAG
ncbi:MAG: hypothetical protein QCI82_04700 [Candidatus Thermoplasmatota archaeon]|nr:hypothetical protein [Candidatus Thermoplasmatota archaeon]